jgi:beta-lactamase class A
MQVLARIPLPAPGRLAAEGSEGRPMRLAPPALQRLAQDAGLAPASVVILPVDPPQPAIALDPHRSFYPASMIKVPLAAAVLATLPNPEALDAPIHITPENMTANDAESPLVPGYAATLRELLFRAVARSDNVATNVLLDLAGRERATRIVREELGLTSTAFHRKLSGADPLIDDPGWDGEHRNAHPAADAARLFQAIAVNAFPGAGLLCDCLAAQYWNDKLTAGLLPGDRFLHKTGETSEVSHDGGILHTADSRCYGVVAYTQLPSTPENDARFGAFMRALRKRL